MRLTRWQRRRVSVALARKRSVLVVRSERGGDARKRLLNVSAVAEGFRDEVVFQVGQDIPIWENKVYLDSPILCDGDGPIAKYRKWFQQFYADAA